MIFGGWGQIFLENSSFNNHHNFCVKDFQSYDSTAVTSLTQITRYQFIIREDKSYTPQHHHRRTRYLPSLKYSSFAYHVCYFRGSQTAEVHSDSSAPATNFVESAKQLNSIVEFAKQSVPDLIDLKSR